MREVCLSRLGHFTTILENLDREKSHYFTSHEDLSIKLVTIGCSARKYIQIELSVF